MAEAKDSKKTEKNEAKVEQRLSGSGRPLGPHEGDPKAAAAVNPTEQARLVRQRQAEAEAEAEKHPDEAPVVPDVFDPPADPVIVDPYADVDTKK